MAYIQLTRGFVTLVDDDLLEELNSYLWYASGLEGRPARRLKAGPKKLIYMYHQILQVLPWVLRSMNMSVHHINHDPLDNRLCNLKVVTVGENNNNRVYERVGIGIDSRHNRYKAYIDQPYKTRINVGTYHTWEEAEIALKQAKLEMGLEDN